MIDAVSVFCHDDAQDYVCRVLKVYFEDRLPYALSAGKHSLPFLCCISTLGQDGSL